VGITTVSCYQQASRGAGRGRRKVLSAPKAAAGLVEGEDLSRDHRGNQLLCSITPASKLLA